MYRPHLIFNIAHIPYCHFILHFTKDLVYSVASLNIAHYACPISQCGSVAPFHMQICGIERQAGCRCWIEAGVSVIWHSNILASMPPIDCQLLPVYI